jgi:acetyltransferase EpsM
LLKAELTATYASVESRPLKIIGCGGHGRVLADIARAAGIAFSGFIDDQPREGAGAPVDGPISSILPGVVSECRIAIGIGDGSTRRRVADQVLAVGGELATLTHPSAVIASDVVLGAGSVVMAGVVINPGTRIGRLAIINTRASVDHDCRIGDYVMIGPGAVLAGGVRVGAGAFVAAGAVIIPRIDVGAGSYVAAGATVIERVRCRTLVAGCPAIEKRRLA